MQITHGAWSRDIAIGTAWRRICHHTKLAGIRDAAFTDNQLTLITMLILIAVSTHKIFYQNTRDQIGRQGDNSVPGQVQTTAGA